MSEVKSKSPVWMRVVLIASLALNLAIVGVVGGAFLRGPEGREDRSVSPGREFRMLAGSLPQAHQDALRKAARAEWRDIRTHRETIKKQRAVLIEALRSDTFDIATFADAMKAQQATWAELGTRGMDMLVDRVRSMTPEERAGFADNLERWEQRQDSKRQRPVHKDK